MELVSFRVKNYRSINDSGEVRIDRITALLGRNESGKSNLLRALAGLNPADGEAALDKVKDFPRHLSFDEFDPDEPVLDTTWKLNAAEKNALKTICPQIKSGSDVTISRSYNVQFEVGIDFEDIPYERQDLVKKINWYVNVVEGKAGELDAEPKQKLEQEINRFKETSAPTEDKVAWSSAFIGAHKALSQAMGVANIVLSEEQEERIGKVLDVAESLRDEESTQQKAIDWLIAKLPTFVFLEEYPELEGHQDLSQYIDRKNNNKLNEADRNFERLCKIAGLNPVELHDLGAEQHEERGHLVNRAGALVTTELKRLWKDRPLKMRLNLDGRHFDTLVSDPNQVYDVEVNLNERSRGFQWFFAFYVVFAANTKKSGSHSQSILLLDEPGLYLHAKSQQDLLRHLITDFENQIIYTTHSPFMVPTQNLEWVRTVNISEETGTTVTNDPSGDKRTLFPLQAALGYDLAQSLFVSGNNLIVEGVTDYWVLSSISDYLSGEGKIGLPDITLTPAGGAQKVPYMASLLASESLGVIVLLDYEKDAEQTKLDLVKSKIVREDNVISVGDAFEDKSELKEADIEDLLDTASYLSLVKDSYAAELKGKNLKLNDKIPRIAKRVELAFKDLGIPFNKSRPTRLFMKRMGETPEKLVTPEVAERFEKLFTIVGEKLEQQKKRNNKPFD